MSIFESNIDEEEFIDDTTADCDGPSDVSLVSSGSNTEQLILPQFVMVIA